MEKEEVAEGVEFTPSDMPAHDLEDEEVRLPPFTIYSHMVLVLHYL